jgi:hypothetical protein
VRQKICPTENLENLAIPAAPPAGGAGEALAGTARFDFNSANRTIQLPRQAVEPKMRVPTSVILENLLSAAPDEQVSLAWIVENLRDRSFGIVILLVALVGLVPGVSPIAGILLAIPAIQMMLGRDEPVLPRRLAARRLSKARLTRLIRRLSPTLQRLERVVRPRWTTPFGATKRTVGLVVLLLGIRRVVIMGAAGRDFHNFNIVYRDDPAHRGGRLHRGADSRHRRAPLSRRARRAALSRRASRSSTRAVCGAVRRAGVDEVVFAYSDVTHVDRHARRPRGRSRPGRFHAARAAAHDARGLAQPVIAVCAVRTGCGKVADRALAVRASCARAACASAVIRHPMPYGDLGAPGGAALREAGTIWPRRLHDRGARGVRAAHRGRLGGLRRRRLCAHPRALRRRKPT